MGWVRIDDRRWRKQRITQPMRQAVAERHGGKPGASVEITCSYCNEAIWVDWTDPERVRFLDKDGTSRPELDHIEPLAFGGPHTADNLTPACLRCNRSKGARSL